MIGYMRPIKKEFNSEEWKVYQAIYCGLCRKLKYQYGFLGTMTLSYEIVDLLLLIEALRKEKPEKMKLSCSLSPLIWKDMLGMEKSYYFIAADIIMWIVNFEIQDNVEDEKRKRDEVLLKISNYKIRKSVCSSEIVYQELKSDYLGYVKKERKAQKDQWGFEDVLEACGRIAGTMGRLLSEAAEIEETTEVEYIMRLWGEWVYLVDATDDYMDDKKNNHFNPWNLKDAPKKWESFVENLENTAIILMNNLSIQRYNNILDKLYRIQIPERRKHVFDKYYKMARGGT